MLCKCSVYRLDKSALTSEPPWKSICMNIVHVLNSKLQHRVMDIRLEAFVILLVKSDKGGT